MAEESPSSPVGITRVRRCLRGRAAGCAAASRRIRGGLFAADRGGFADSRRIIRGGLVAADCLRRIICGAEAGAGRWRPRAQAEELEALNAKLSEQCRSLSEYAQQVLALAHREGLAR